MSAVNEILVYLAQTVIHLALFAVLLRFILQAVQADFYNPICQFVARVTNPVVVPLRRVIPGFAGQDMAALLLALLLQMLAIVTMLLLYGVGLPNIGVLLAWSAVGLIALVVNIYFFALLAMIIISWVAGGSRHPAIILLYQVTEPVMAPFRRLLPTAGGLDFSPILVFILINVLQIALRHLATGIGLHPALVVGL